jgi:hypothetical protein
MELARGERRRKERTLRVDHLPHAVARRPDLVRCLPTSQVSGSAYRYCASWRTVLGFEVWQFVWQLLVESPAWDGGKFRRIGDSSP